MKKFTLVLALMLALLSINTFAGDVGSSGRTDCPPETTCEGDVGSSGRDGDVGSSGRSDAGSTQSNQSDSDDDEWYDDVLDYFGSLFGSDGN